MTRTGQAVTALLFLLLLAAPPLSAETIEEKIKRGRDLLATDAKKGGAILQEAAAELEKAAAEKPGDYDTQLNLGKAYYFQEKDKKALAAFGRAAAIAPKKSAPHFYSGVIHRYGDDLDGSLKELTLACRTDPGDGGCWCELGRTLRARDELPEALAALQRACRLQPDDVPTLFETGTLLTVLGHDEKAIDLFLKALTIDPDQGNIAFNAGQCCQNLGRHKQALGHFLTATRLDPADWNAITKTIQEYETLGMEEERDRARDVLYRLRKKGKIESLNKANLYIREQFECGDKKIFVIEYFEMKGSMAKKLSFNIKKRKTGKLLYKVSLGSYDFTNTMAKISGELSEGNRIWHLDRYTGKKHTTISFFDGEPPYDVVRSLVVEVIEGRIK
jgi:tetratricopeptide (TPR) repeat protein